MKDVDLRTSEEWQKIYTVKVLDPDGWDRANFKYSWYEEKISREEFVKRVMPSTCMFIDGIFPGDKRQWKDQHERDI